MLDLSYNDLVTVPAEVGWLPLKQLRVHGNPRLKIPAPVVERGFRCAAAQDSIFLGATRVK